MSLKKSFTALSTPCPPPGPAFAEVGADVSADVAAALLSVGRLASVDGALADVLACEEPPAPASALLSAKGFAAQRAISPAMTRTAAAAAIHSPRPPRRAGSEAGSTRCHSRGGGGGGVDARGAGGGDCTGGAGVAAAAAASAGKLAVRARPGAVEPTSVRASRI